MLPVLGWYALALLCGLMTWVILITPFGLNVNKVRYGVDTLVAVIAACFMVGGLCCVLKGSWLLLPLVS